MSEDDPQIGVFELMNLLKDCDTQFLAPVCEVLARYVYSDVSRGLEKLLIRAKRPELLFDDEFMDHFHDMEINPEKLVKMCFFSTSPAEIIDNLTKLVSSGRVDLSKRWSVDLIHRGISSWREETIIARLLGTLCSEMETYGEAGRFLFSFFDSDESTFSEDDTKQLLRLILSKNYLNDLGGSPENFSRALGRFANLAKEELEDFESSDSEGSLVDFIVDDSDEGSENGSTRESSSGSDDSDAGSTSGSEISHNSPKRLKKEIPTLSAKKATVGRKRQLRSSNSDSSSSSDSSSVSSASSASLSSSSTDVEPVRKVLNPSMKARQSSVHSTTQLRKEKEKSRNKWVVDDSEDNFSPVKGTAKSSASVIKKTPSKNVVSPTNFKSPLIQRKSSDSSNSSDSSDSSDVFKGHSARQGTKKDSSNSETHKSKPREGTPSSAKKSQITDTSGVSMLHDFLGDL